MIPVGRLAPGNQWDQNLLDRLFANKLYPTGLDFRRFEGYPNTEGCILLVPSRYWSAHTDQIEEALSRYRWVLGMRCGDEEDTFDIAKVSHPNMKWWVQYPRCRDYGDARLLGVGFTPHFNELPAVPPSKDTDVYLSGQLTHDRRKECFDALETWDGDKVVRPTEGFTDGFEPAEYMRGVLSAKVCPAPSGAVSVDTFRLWEAIAAHSVPIADAVSPVDGDTDYWDRVCPGAPFPVLRDHDSLPGYLDDALEQWPSNANRIAAWWMRYKRSLALGLREDLEALGAL